MQINYHLHGKFSTIPITLQINYVNSPILYGLNLVSPHLDMYLENVFAFWVMVSLACVCIVLMLPLPTAARNFVLRSFVCSECVYV